MSSAERSRRHRLHCRGDHSECLPDRPCRRIPPAALDALTVAPAARRGLLELELNRTRAHLEALAAALQAEPLNIGLLVERRGQVRTMASLLEALGKLRASAPVVPIENPLEALRRRRAVRQAGSSDG